MYPRLGTPALGQRVVNDLVNVVVQAFISSEHECFDNVFTSYALLSDLRDREMVATGTIPGNRTAEAANAIIDSKSLKKERGTFDYSCDGKILICK